MYYISEKVGIPVSPNGSQVFSRAVVNNFALLIGSCRIAFRKQASAYISSSTRAPSSLVSSCSGLQLAVGL